MDATFDPYHLWLGIPPAEQPPHHYRLLGLTLFESNRAVIDDAASRQTLHVQGYRAGSHAQAAQRILGELAAARACLLNAATKAAYDDELRRSLEFPATDRPRQPASDSPRNVVVVAAPDPHLPVRARNLAEAPVIPSIPLDDEDPVTDETPTPESLAATPRSAPVGRGSRWRGPLLAGVGAMLFIPLAMAIVGPREPLPETVAQATPAPLAATGESSKAGPAVERTTPIEAIAEATQPSTESHPAIEHAPPASPASVATLKLPAPAGKPRLGQVWTQAIDGMGDVGRSVAALVAVQASMYVPPATHEIAEEPLSVPRKAAARWPAPNEFDLKEAETIVAEFEKSVRETNDDLDSWEGASWKTINTLFDRATNQESRPAIAFQLLIRAEALAAGRDGFSPTERPADERAEMFELDVPTYVAELAASLKRKPLYENRPPDPLDQSRPLRWLGLADRAASDEDFALAAACCESARLWAQHFDDPPLRDLVARRTADVETVAAAFERAKFARERWRAVRDDASAAAEWGRYLCLFAGDFPHGAKHLAKGTDLAAKAARAELTAPVDDAAAVVLGDLWWDAAEAEADPFARRQALRRAGAWYRRSGPGVDALAKKQVEDRLEKYNAEFPPLPLNQWVDLAGYVDPFQHALGGFWERDGEKLVAEDGIQDCRLAVPVVPTGAYELDLGIYRGLHPIGKPRRTYSGMEQPQAPNDFQFVFPVGDRYARIAWASSGPVDYRLDGQPDYRVLLGNGSKRLRSGKSATFDEIGSRYVSCQLTVDAVSPRTEIVLWKQRERDLNWAGRLTDLPTAAGTAVEPRCFRIESPYGGAEVRSLWLRVLSGPVRLDMN